MDGHFHKTQKREGRKNEHPLSARCHKPNSTQQKREGRKDEQTMMSAHHHKPNSEKVITTNKKEKRRKRVTGMNKQSNAHRRKYFLISIIYFYYYAHIVRNLISVNCRRINSKKRLIAGCGPLGRLEMRCMKARPRWFVMTIYSQKSLVSSSVWSVII